MTTEPAARLRGIAGVVLAIRFLTELALLAGIVVAVAGIGFAALTRVFAKDG